MTRKPATAAPILAAVLIVAGVLLAAYVAGYFWLGTAVTVVDNGSLLLIERTFDQKWAGEIYRPAGKLEGWLRGIAVAISWSGEPRVRFQPLPPVRIKRVP